MVEAHKRGRQAHSSDEEAMSQKQKTNSYPRKRVAIACDVCRVRKTRCDAAKPSCSFCRDSEIECRYSGPSQDDRKPTSTVDTDYARTIQRLEDIQSTLDAVAAAVGAGAKDQASLLSPLQQEGSLQGTSPASYTAIVKKAPIPRMPNLFVFKALETSRTANSWSYDCTKDFFRHQMTVEEDICSAAKISSLQIDLEKPHVWRLQRSFVENVLKWLPLFDHATATRYLQRVEMDAQEEDDECVCLVLLMYANGALAADSHLYTTSPLDLAGFTYYTRAMTALRKLPRSGENLCTLQCYVLSSIYLLIALRPLEAWKMIRQASQTCIFLLKARAIHQSADYKDAFNRIYWICYVLESELEVSLELPTSGLRAYEEIVELPTSHYEEEGMYNLLALSSLRRLMVEVIDTVGLRSPAANYAPVVTLELRNQIDFWNQHLPSSLSFTSEHSLLFDMRKAYLRCMYFALIVVALWPFVARCKDITHDGTRTAIDESMLREEDRAQMQRGAHECLEAARKYLHVAEEILTQKTLVSHMVIRR